jgi:hypothetical protein
MKRGGRVKEVDAVTGEIVKYETFLEKMSRKEKYAFVKEHNHPFAAYVGIPYFNPYGKVPLDEKLTPVITKCGNYPMFMAIGLRYDYPEYLEACVSTTLTCTLT